MLIQDGEISSLGNNLKLKSEQVGKPKISMKQSSAQFAEPLHTHSVKHSDDRSAKSSKDRFESKSSSDRFASKSSSDRSVKLSNDRSVKNFNDHTASSAYDRITGNTRPNASADKNAPRIISKTAVDKELPKTWKKFDQTRVAFNLAKLRNLSGAEKIDLLKDYIKTKSPAEAVLVYKTLIKNDIDNRLDYKDHHNMFRLLLNDKTKNRDEISLVRHTLLKNGFKPTEYFLNEYCACCCEWENIEAALSTLEELNVAGFGVTTMTWDALFGYYNLEQQNKEVAEEGVKLYEKMKNVTPLVRPTTQIYLKVISIYGKCGKVTEAKDVYLDAEENLSRLYNQYIIGTGPKLEEWAYKLNTKISFFNAYLDAVFVNSSVRNGYDGCTEAFKEFLKNGNSVFDSQESSADGLKAWSNTFHILLKSVVLHPAEDRPDVLRQLLKDMHHLGIPLNHLHYSRYISLIGDQKDLIQMYREAIQTLNISPTGSKRQSLDSSYLLALADLDLKYCVEEMGKIRGMGTKKPFRIVYEKLLKLTKIDLDAQELVASWIRTDQIKINE